ncbi:MAG: hypothetical protein Q7V05_11165, partial [Methanoregula sp.]|nr:hypothetical protein [Methanoregula sp.]
PSMKAQSEITHIKDVESGFLRFSSDIDTAVSLKKSMKLSEPIPLGGGDFTFDPVKSGGELKVWNASPAGYMRLNWTNETEPPSQNHYTSPDHYSGLVKFSYLPVNNFWQDQGYRWSYGNVYVINSERNLSTPLKFARMDDVTYGLAGSLVDLEPVPLYTTPGNCSSITVHTINIIPDSRHFRISGNGNGMLVLESNVSTERVLNATSMNLSITASPYGRFNTTLWDSLDTSVKKTLASCGNVERTDPAPREIRLTFQNPYPNSSYSNLTLIRKTTEITIGAY